MINLIANYSSSFIATFVALYHLSLLALLSLLFVSSVRRWVNMTRSTNGQKASDNVSEKCVMYYGDDKKDIFLPDRKSKFALSPAHFSEICSGSTGVARKAGGKPGGKGGTKC